MWPLYVHTTLPDSSQECFSDSTDLTEVNHEFSMLEISIDAALKALWLEEDTKGEAEGPRTDVGIFGEFEVEDKDCLSVSFILEKGSIQEDKFESLFFFVKN